MLRLINILSTFGICLALQSCQTNCRQRPDIDEQALMSILSSKRSAFQRVQMEAFQAESKGFRIGSSDSDVTGLSGDQLVQLRSSLAALGSNVALTMNSFDHILYFTFSSGGSDLSIGTQWSYGIEYIGPDAHRYGKIVKTFKNLDLMKEGCNYLIPIENHWYIFYNNG
jgi:hypothetical protein